MLQQEWLVTEWSGSMLPHAYVALCIKSFPFQTLLVVAIHNTRVSNLNEVAFVNRLSATQQLVTAVLTYQQAQKQLPMESKSPLATILRIQLLS